jgi:hypothetical protein
MVRFHKRIAAEAADHLSLLGFDEAAVATIAGDHTGDTLIAVTGNTAIDPDDERQHARDRLSALALLPQPDLGTVLDLVAHERRVQRGRCG